MSIHVMSQVWKRAQFAGGELLVLLALADWADDDGVCWPSLPAIAEKSRLSERQVYRLIAVFRAVGILTLQSGGGRGKRNVYRINPDNMSGFSIARNPDASDRVSRGKTLTPVTLNPDTGVKSPRPPNRKNRQEPSIQQIQIQNPPTPLENPRGALWDEKTESEELHGENATSDSGIEPVPACATAAKSSGVCETARSSRIHAELDGGSPGAAASELPVRRVPVRTAGRSAPGIDSPTDADPLTIRVGRVMRGCGFTQRRLQPVIAAAMAQYMASGVSADETAALMIGNWSQYVRDGPLLRYVWSPRKFFGDGHWRNWELWPLDRERMERMQHASVGTRR